MLVGPIAPFHENSIYYSAIRPRPDPEVDRNLPHITIEMPVYKESLKETITPSIFSIKKAMQTYARQGGSSSILIHDDGLQLLSESDRLARTAFYSDHNIGYVARPPHDSSEGGFKRAGRFKKASNMNYGLALSLKLETQLARLESGEVDPTTATGDSLEDKALQLALDEVYEESGRRFRPWADNARALRIGEIILIVDSDTIVPEDCLRDAAREMAQCPEVAIIQHESDVLQVAHHYFENGIAYFTRRVNRTISFACANGEVAAFVGHNAFLRWSAVQEVAFVDPTDGIKKIWSDSNVSEDFDMALRLQLQNYVIRWATYSEGGFKEGVSLTPDDELNRWEKYSYGVGELMFHPFKDWWRKGPITKQLRTFIWSPAPVHYKISMMAYMFSYFGIASGFVLTVMNFFLLAWGSDIDGYYMHSFEIWLACLVVFPGSGSLAFTVLEYRLGQRGLVEAGIEMATWIPFLSVGLFSFHCVTIANYCSSFFFFGGMSIHLSKALLAYLFSYNIQWGATKKEVERSNFFIEVPRILKRFRVAFGLSFLCIVAMIVVSVALV
jgi:cellulose synthase/poly-beta-1,6-N-acetylglucosamine synthase-like glycosyltransferase